MNLFNLGDKGKSFCLGDTGNDLPGFLIVIGCYKLVFKLICLGFIFKGC